MPDSELNKSIQFGMAQISWQGYIVSCNEYGFLWWRRWHVVAWRGALRYESRHKSPLAALEAVFRMLPEFGEGE